MDGSDKARLKMCACMYAMHVRWQPLGGGAGAAPVKLAGALQATGFRLAYYSCELFTAVVLISQPAFLE